MHAFENLYLGSLQCRACLKIYPTKVNLRRHLTAISVCLAIQRVFFPFGSGTPLQPPSKDVDSTVVDVVVVVTVTEVAVVSVAVDVVVVAVAVSVVVVAVAVDAVVMAVVEVKVNVDVTETCLVRINCKDAET